MNRALILTNTLKTGGAEKQSIYLFNALKSNYDSRLIVYYGNQLDKRITTLIENDDNSIIYLKGTHLSKLITLYRLFKKDSSTICISYLATTNTINAIVGKFAKVKVRIGGIRSSEFGWMKKLIQRHLHNNWLSCSVFNNYLGFHSLISQGFNKSKSCVILNCIDIPTPRNYINRANEIQILSVGRFVEAKDYISSFMSIHELTKIYPGLKYTIIGQGYLEEELKTYVTVNGLEKFVEFVVNPPGVDAYYRNADIYLSTSIFEGLSNSIMEAMSFGLPVVATDVGDNSYLVKDKETGFLVPVRDSDSIAQKLLLLIKDSDLRKSMGAKGYEHIKSNFSIEKFTQEYISLIERLANEAK